jgi:hypothetical protein
MDMFKFSGLDPAHYISLPSFAFDVMLYTTKAHIKYLSDINMVHFIDSAIRGGLSFINTRHFRADNPAEEEIVYIDANNLYGVAQMCLLPYDNIRWVPEDRFNRFDWLTIDTESNQGYILEVDLDYPEHLHDLHSNFPLAPETVEVSYSDLSPYSQDVYFELNSCRTYRDRKLLSSLNGKKNYITHFKNLKLYLQLGMQLKRVHRVLCFRQKALFAPFIEKCTQARQQSKTKFEQDQFKKLANSVYGKTIQNVRNYSKSLFVRDIDGFLKYTSDIFFKSYYIIDENLVQINMIVNRIIHDRPTYIGFTILELSKHHMFNFFYNVLLRNCPSTIDLGMTDTDSFLFKVDKPAHFRKHVQKYMDYSNYPVSHKFFNTSNKAIPGFFKDELAGKYTCSEFIGLKSKCYAMDLVDISTKKHTEKKTCKGLGRLAIQNRLKFKHYKDSLQHGIPKRFDFQTIRSKRQHISTIRMNKKIITHFDSKRWLYSCGIHSDPYGKCNLTSSCPKCL